MTPLTEYERIVLHRAGLLPRNIITRQSFGHHYGKLGGKIRAMNLTKKRRLEIALIASAAAKRKRDASKKNPGHWELGTNNGKRCKSP